MEPNLRGNSRSLTWNHHQNLKKRWRDSNIRLNKSSGSERKIKEDENVTMYLSSVVLSNRLTSGASVLRDITNNNIFLEDDSKTKTKSLRKKDEVALERWKMLAKALLKTKTKVPLKSAKMKDVSVRRFSSFHLIMPNKLEKTDKLLDSRWLTYTTNILNKSYQIEIHHLEQKLTPKELIGFNNTGNICIWPSEEVLTYYVLSNVQAFEGQEILEVGGGMTCLAGIMLGKYGKSKRVDLTDGNPMSVDNVNEIIWRNELDKSTVSSFRLDWVNHKQLSKKYDFVLSSDCLFFDDTRGDLVETIWNSLKDDGVAVVMAPKRGTTLDCFVKMAAEKGFCCIIQTYYQETVWKQHLKFKKSTPEYDEDIHYPILLLLTKYNREFPFSCFVPNALP